MMNTLGRPAETLTTKDLTLSQSRRREVILGRIDLIAIVTALLGLCLLALVAAAIQLAKLIAYLCADPIDRWLVVVLGLAVLWLIARGKKLCVV